MPRTYEGTSAYYYGIADEKNFSGKKKIPEKDEKIIELKKKAQILRELDEGEEKIRLKKKQKQKEIAKKWEEKFDKLNCDMDVIDIISCWVNWTTYKFSFKNGLYYSDVCGWEITKLRNWTPIYVADCEKIYDKIYKKLMKKINKRLEKYEKSKRKNPKYCPHCGLKKGEDE